MQKNSDKIRKTVVIWKLVNGSFSKKVRKNVRVSTIVEDFIKSQKQKGLVPNKIEFT